jgi:hypothetical protein
MNFETFARLHPIGYVLMAYSVVWVLLFGYAIWIAFQWSRATKP